MAEGIDATTADVHAIARGSAAHLDQLLDVDLVQRLAGSVGQSALSLSYRTVLRYDLAGMGDMLEDEDEDRAAMDEDEEKPMRYRFVMSDALPDRADDIVEQTWDLSEFAANPVAPYNHDYSAPPIGRWENVRATGGVLRGTLVPVAVESYPLSMTVAALLEQKVLRTVSVGFRPAAVIARASLPEEDIPVQRSHARSQRSLSRGRSPAQPRGYHGTRRRPSRARLAFRGLDMFTRSCSVIEHEQRPRWAQSPKRSRYNAPDSGRVAGFRSHDRAQSPAAGR
jgi:hypothetical protein